MSQPDKNELEEELQKVAGRLTESVPDLETLEIYAQNEGLIHLAFNTSKSDNIPSLVSFLDVPEPGPDPEETLRKSLCNNEFIYKGFKYTFNRVAALSEDYIAIIMISRDEIDGHKRGLVLVVDAVGVFFIGTCRSEMLRKFNLDFMTALYPCM